MISAPLIPFAFSFVGSKVREYGSKTKSQSPILALTGKRVLLVIASKGFQKEEYFGIKYGLEEHGAIVSTTSNKTGIATSKDGTPIKIHVAVGDINVNEFDGLFLIGGKGALQCLDNELTYKLVQQADELEKIYGAICASPRILAKSGVLKGKTSTGWNGDGELPKILEEHDATWQDSSVTVDGNIVTGRDPYSVPMFVSKAVTLLQD